MVTVWKGCGWDVKKIVDNRGDFLGSKTCPQLSTNRSQDVQNQMDAKDGEKREGDRVVQKSTGLTVNTMHFFEETD